MSANPKSEASLRVEKKLNRKVQGSSTSNRAHQQDYNEKIRRDEEPQDVVAAIPAPRFINAPTPPATMIPAASARDWHKKSDWYNTVTPTNKIVVDADADPSAYHTITDAINQAKIIFPSLSAIFTNPVIEIEVHGGQYTENITVDVSYLRFRGIGRPEIYGQFIVASTCTKVVVDEFVIYNASAPIFFIVDPTLSLAGIVIQEGVDSSKNLPNVQFYNCVIQGDNTQIFCQRRAYFENCQTISTFDYWAGSVYCEFVTTQAKWTIFNNCHLHGYNDGSDYRKRGNALTIAGVTFANGSNVWYSNAQTSGAGPRILTGVVLDHCTIDGWTQNYGWNLQYQQGTYGIEGKFINNTSGSVHHHIWCNSDAGVNAYTWFDHTEVAVRYMVETNDSSVAAVPSATCNVWLRHSEHTGPDGGAVVQSPQAVLPNTGVGGGFVLTNVWYSAFATHAIKIYCQGAGPELGVGMPVYIVGGIDFLGGVNIPAIMKKGYINF